MFSKNTIESIDLSTRAKRRKVTSLVVEVLDNVKTFEESVLARTPENLQNADAYQKTEISAEAIGDAIDILIDAY